MDTIQKDSDGFSMDDLLQEIKSLPGERVVLDKLYDCIKELEARADVLVEKISCLTCTYMVEVEGEPSKCAHPNNMSLKQTDIGYLKTYSSCQDSNSCGACPYYKACSA